MLRRLLLMLVTALLVARPLILGEDPGLTSNLSDPWGMVLTLLWLLAAVGWAAWRFRFRLAPEGTDKTSPNPGNWYGGWVQTALLATVALVFLSAEIAARYKFPARLIAWEWFGLFTAFFVVRQMAVSPDEQNGLFAVVLAGAVALAGQGVYQKFVEMPSTRRSAEDPEKFRAEWAEVSGGENMDEDHIERLRRRALEDNIFGPYAHPNSYAGYLVLWLPGLIGAAILFWRLRAPNWQTALAVGFALLGAAALWWTHSRGAMLGLVLAGIGVGVLIWREKLRRHWIAALAGAVLLAGLGYGAGRSGLLTTGMGKSAATAMQRGEYWQTTWRMIGERPWLGVGPGNFSQNYTRLLSPSAAEKIKDPHNFALEIAATCGVFALLALLAAIGTFFYRTIRGIGWDCVGWTDEGPHPDPQGGLPSSAHPTETPTDALPPVRWEFYVGGMIGLLLGFVLRANGLPSSAILGETWAALVRSVVWFAAFGLLERLIWPSRGRALVLLTGVGALLVNLCVSGGINFPSVAGPLWIAVALALNAVSLRPTAWLSRPGAAMILPLPLLVGVLIGYGVYLFYPVAASYLQTQEAFVAVEAIRHNQIKGDRVAVMRRNVIGRLEAAARRTPDDARLRVQLAWWYGLLWYQTQINTGNSDLPIAEEALRQGMEAARLDPEGGQGYWVQFAVRTRFFAGRNEEVMATGRNREPLFLAERKEAARNQYEYAAKVLEKYRPYDPNDAVLCFQLARAWREASEKEKSREWAEEAARLDEAAVSPMRKLADPQRKQLQEWLSVPSSG